MILIGGGALGLFGGFALAKWIKRERRHAVFDRMTEAGSPAWVAQQLDNGIHPDSPFGLGTDEELIRRTIISAVPHLDFWKQVERDYGRLNPGRNLNSDLESDLNRTEWDEIRSILAAKPRNQAEAQGRGASWYDERMLELWAKRIKNACDYEQGWLWPYGTDEEAIYAVFEEIPSMEALAELDKTYKRLYGLGLPEQLVDELDTDEKQNIMKIIKRKFNV